MELNIFKNIKISDDWWEKWEKTTKNVIVQNKHKFQHKITRVVVYVVDHEEIQRLHMLYFGDEATTDVISFPYVKPTVVEGEIYVNYEYAVNFARTHDVPLEEEMFRYVIHGMLHVDGLDDQREEEYLRMKQKEEEWLEIFRMFHVEQ